MKTIVCILTTALMLPYTATFAQMSLVTTPEKSFHRTIEVTGSAEMEVTPDEVYVSFTLQEYWNKDKKKLLIEDLSLKFVEKCVGAGVPKDQVQVSGATGYERYDWYWKDKRKREPDFMATLTYVVKVTGFDQLEKILKTVDSEGLQGYYIQKMTHSKIEDYRREVKIMALIAAKNKAAYLAAAIGESIGAAISIKEVEDPSYYQPYMYNMRVANNKFEDGSDATGSELEFRKIKIRYEMHCIFELK